MDGVVLLMKYRGVEYGGKDMICMIWCEEVCLLLDCSCRWM